MDIGCNGCWNADSGGDPASVGWTAGAGVFDVIVDGAGIDLAEAVDLALQRFVEHRRRHPGPDRETLVEQAKGILMGYRLIDAEAAAGVLAEEAERSGKEIAEVAASLVQSHDLLVGARPATAPASD
jgi:AmiR/NasT family two-component response regulator